MSLAAVLTPLPVLIPTVGAAVTLFAGRRPRLQRAIALGRAVRGGRGVRGAALPRRPDGTLALHVGGWGQLCPAWGRWASRWWSTGCRR